MMQLPTGSWDIWYQTTLPWLKDLQHLPPASFRRLTKLIPSLHANVELILASQDPDDDDDEMADATGDALSVAPIAGPSEALIRNDPPIRCLAGLLVWSFLNPPFSF
jgi:hypothetical protein